MTVNLGPGYIHSKYGVPVASETDWFIVVADPKTADSAANILKPSAITRTGQQNALVNHCGTSLLVCMRYATGTPVTTDPIVQIVGVDGNGVPTILKDADGAVSWAMPYVLATNVQDANGDSFSSPIEVDCENCKSVWILVATAMIGGGTVDIGAANSPAIMAKLK